MTCKMTCINDTGHAQEFGVHFFPDEIIRFAILGFKNVQCDLVRNTLHTSAAF